jgi:hypothetical protein
VKTTPKGSPRAATERRRHWTAPRLQPLPPLIDLTLTTGPDVGKEDNPGLFSFRPGGSALG